MSRISGKGSKSVPDLDTLSSHCWFGAAYIGARILGMGAFNVTRSQSIAATIAITDAVVIERCKTEKNSSWRFVLLVCLYSALNRSSRACRSLLKSLVSLDSISARDFEKAAWSLRMRRNALSVSTRRFADSLMASISPEFLADAIDPLRRCIRLRSWPSVSSSGSSANHLFRRSQLCSILSCENFSCRTWVVGSFSFILALSRYPFPCGQRR